MAFSTANAFDIISRLDRNDTLDDVPQNKSRKLPPVYFWTNFINKTLLGLSLVVSRELWDRSVVIVLLTSCHKRNLFRVLLVLGYSLVSFASSVMGSALHRFHTEEHDHTCRIGCPYEPDSLTYYNVCPRLYNIFLETCYDIATKKLLVTRLDLPGVLVEPSIWYCGSGLP